MSIEKKFGGGVAWMAMGNWIEQGINFALFVILARILGAESFGLLAMAAALVLVSESLVRESLSDFLIACKDPTPEHFNALFWMLALLGCILCGGLLAGAGFIAGLFGEPQVVGLVRTLSPTVLLIALTAVPVAILRREMRFATLSLRAIAGVTVGGAVALVMALSGFGVWALAGQRLAQVLTNVVMAWAAVSWRPAFSFSRPHGQEIFGFGGAVLGLRGAELAALQLPSILIGAAHGPAVLGLFTIAWRVVEIGSFLIVTPLRMAAQPAFAALRRQGQDSAQLLINITKLSGLIALPAFAGLAILSDPMIQLLFGQQWVDAAPALSVLSVFGAYLCIEKINQAFCLSAGQAKATALVSWTEVGVSSMCVWLAASLGMVAMAGALVLAFLLIWPVRLGVVAKIAGLDRRTLARVHLKPLLATIVMAGVVQGWIIATPEYSPLATVVTGSLTGIMVIALAVWITMRPRIRLLATFFGKSI